MKKVLIVANTDRHIELCYIPYIKWFKENDFIVHVATNTNKDIPNCSKKIALSIHRAPFKFGNIKAIKTLTQILDKENYDLISTSTPMGAVIARLAARKLKKRPKILYTAHGFHFFKGAPIINWLLYYPIEKYLIQYTDMLVTINEEDYNFSLKHFNIPIYYIKGIGYHQDKFSKKLTTRQKQKYRQKLNINNDDFVITYLAEISKRKRQEYLVKTLSQMNLKNIKILLVGEDNLHQKIHKLVKKLNLQDKILFLGFRNDINEILEITDLVISVSKQEGLPLNIMEAMAKQKPIIVTDCRGNRDLISNKENGLIVPLNDQKKLIYAIKKLKKDYEYATKLGKNNQKKVEQFDIKNILPQYVQIYKEILK